MGNVEKQNNSINNNPPKEVDAQREGDLALAAAESISNPEFRTLSGMTTDGHNNVYGTTSQRILESYKTVAGLTADINRMRIIENAVNLNTPDKALTKLNELVGNSAVFTEKIKNNLSIPLSKYSNIIANGKFDDGGNFSLNAAEKAMAQVCISDIATILENEFVLGPKSGWNKTEWQTVREIADGFGLE